jgi:predicted nucleotidyltransferase
VTVDRSDLLEHLRRTRFAAGDAPAARRDAERIAHALEERYGSEVWGIGSLFEKTRPFRMGSDIDLVVRGIPKGVYFEALAYAQSLTRYDLDLIPWEDANDLVREIVAEAGVRL